MKSLFKIQEEYSQLLEEIEEAEGILDEETEKKLAIAQHELSTKVVAYDHIIKMLESQSKLADAEMERIKKFKQVKENTIERMKSALLQALLMFGEKDKKKDIWRLDAETVRLSTRQNKSTVIDDAGEIDEKFMKYEISNMSAAQFEAAMNAISELEDNTPARTGVTVPKGDVKKAIEDDPEKTETDTAITSKKVPGAHIDIKYSISIR